MREILTPGSHPWTLRRSLLSFLLFFPGVGGNVPWWILDAGVTYGLFVSSVSGTLRQGPSESQGVVPLLFLLLQWRQV